MSKKEHVIEVTIEGTSGQRGQPRRITIAEARRKAFEASDNAQQSQVAYAENEAKSRYDYRVEE